jgi:hypothetical protein
MPNWEKSRFQSEVQKFESKYFTIWTVQGMGSSQHWESIMGAGGMAQVVKHLPSESW